MSEPKLENSDIQRALDALGSGPLEEQSLRTHIHPLFSNVLQRGEIYLANHSLGRPLDQTNQDVQQALAYWYEDIEDAWGYWLDEIQSFRQCIAQLIHAPSEDCIVPKTSAGQGLRAILNCYDEKIHVVTTTAEFSSIDHILKVYEQRNRISLQCIKPDNRGIYHEEDLLEAVQNSPTLVVVSMVLFHNGSVFY